MIDCREVLRVRNADEADGGLNGQTMALVAALATTAGGAALWWLHHRRARLVTPPIERTRESAAAAALCREWLVHDPDPATREIVQGWMGSDKGDVVRSASQQFILNRLSTASRLRFGTAGLRAEMGPGYDRMNVYSVIAATQGVLRVMQKMDTKALLNNPEAGIAIGYDARHCSKLFATATAAVFESAGVRVRLFSRPVPTPLVAFSVLHYFLAGCVVITASHNPKQDNGYKLYWSDGAQIRPPLDKVIEAEIVVESKPWIKYNLDESELRKSPLVSDVTDECVAAYIESASASLRGDFNASLSDPVVYSACHGVGHPYIAKMFAAFGLPSVIPVDEQTLQPDPDFSTLPKPNPEEEGALDMTIAKAKSCCARVFIANDPDADRLSAGEIESKTGQVRIFTGDEMSLLFADYLLLRHAEVNRSNLAVVASTVSSKRLASMARAEGFEFHETLTGFKWIARRAAELEVDGKTVILGYEEAIGFMLGNKVHDKDGVSAAAVLVECAAYWRMPENGGNSLLQRLDLLTTKYGSHLGHNGYLSLTSESTPLEAIFSAARGAGMPTYLGECKVAGVRDLTKGTDTAQADGRARLPTDDSTQFITFSCRSPLLDGDEESLDDVVISLRGSGTEPKCKFYSEIRCSQESARTGVGLSILRRAVNDAIDTLLKPDINGLSL
jgi:phosphomannomutase